MRHLLLVLALAIPIPAFAGSATYFGATMTITSTQVLTSGWATQFLHVINQSPSTIACAFGAAAVMSGAGSINIPSETRIFWDNGTVPAGEMNCLVSTGTANATVGYK